MDDDAMRGGKSRTAQPYASTVHPTDRPTVLPLLYAIVSGNLNPRATLLINHLILTSVLIDP